MILTKKHNLFQGVLLLRAIAAIVILLFHITSEAQTRFHYRFLFGLFGWGHIGVDLFFVLSGFLLYVTYQNKFGKRKEIKKYVWKRFMRIYPVYWIICLGILLIYFFWKPSFSQGITYNAWFFFSIFTLIPHGPEITSPVWYLKHQIYLYLFFTLFFIVKRKEIIITVIVCYIFSIFIYLFLVHNIAVLKIVYDFTSLWFSPYVLEFFIGIFIGSLKSKFYFSAKQGVYLIISGIFLLIFSQNVIHFILRSDYYVNILRFMTYGIPFAMITYGLVTYESQKPFRLPQILLLIGKSSYVLYLAQMVIIQSIFFKLGPIIYMDKSRLILNMTAMGMVVLIVSFSIIFYLKIEKPLLSSLK